MKKESYVSKIFHCFHLTKRWTLGKFLFVCFSTISKLFAIGYHYTGFSTDVVSSFVEISITFYEKICPLSNIICDYTKFLCLFELEHPIYFDILLLLVQYTDIFILASRPNCFNITQLLFVTRFPWTSRLALV